MYNVLLDDFLNLVDNQLLFGIFSKVNVIKFVSEVT